MSDREELGRHNALARHCIILTTPRIPPHMLRDDVRCPACDDLHRLMHLDPDVTEILTREEWCDACVAGDKLIRKTDTEKKAAKS